MKRYALYWLRAITLGAGLNALICGYLMNSRDWKFHHAAPVGAFIAINCSFAADRLIFGNKKQEEEKPIPVPITTPHACPICSDFPCACSAIRR